MALLQSPNTIAVILGASDWTRARLPIALSFRRSAADFELYLLRKSPQGLGLRAELMLNLFDDPSPANTQLIQIGETVGNLVRERLDTESPIRDILIYYVGHGCSEGGRHLHLLVRDSVAGFEEQSSISTFDLAQILRVAAPQQRRLAIFDCCFSEAATQAFGAMGTIDEAVAATAMKDLAPELPTPERGTLLLCSSPRKLISIGLPNAEHTLFTGSFLSVLRDGVPSHRLPMFSFADLKEHIFDRMGRDYDRPPRPALHQPDQQAGDLTHLAAFPNAAHRRKKTEPKQSSNGEPAARVRNLPTRQKPKPTSEISGGHKAESDYSGDAWDQALNDRLFSSDPAQYFKNVDHLCDKNYEEYAAKRSYILASINWTKEFDGSWSKLVPRYVDHLKIAGGHVFTNNTRKSLFIEWRIERRRFKGLVRFRTCFLGPGESRFVYSSFVESTSKIKVWAG
jgi:hypothetical protein